MKRRMIAMGMVCVLLLGLLVGCGNSDPTGNWVCEEVVDGYPDVMTLNSDGTGTVDGFSMSWYTDGSELTMNVGIWGTLSYEYEVNGSTLFLDVYSYKKQ